jgi:hypothetical protein
MALTNLNPVWSSGECNKLATVRIIRGQPWPFDSKQDAVPRVAAMTALGRRSSSRPAKQCLPMALRNRAAEENGENVSYSDLSAPVQDSLVAINRADERLVVGEKAKIMTKREDLKRFSKVKELRVKKLDEIRRLLSISSDADDQEVLGIIKWWREIGAGEASVPSDLKTKVNRLLSEFHTLNDAKLEILDKLKVFR